MYCNLYLLAYLYRQNSRSQVWPSYVCLTAYSILAEYGLVCLRFDSADHPAGFLLFGSDVLFVRPAVSFLKSLSSDNACCVFLGSDGLYLLPTQRLGKEAEL
jgi:hypothetical protein